MTEDEEDVRYIQKKGTGRPISTRVQVKPKRHDTRRIKATIRALEDDELADVAAYIAVEATRRLKNDYAARRREKKRVRVQAAHKAQETMRQKRVAAKTEGAG